MSELGWTTINELGAKPEVSDTDIKKKQDDEDLAKAYYRLFKTDDGVRVINHLANTFIFNNNTPLSSANIEYVSAYKNGESGLVKYILSQIAIAETL